VKLPSELTLEARKSQVRKALRRDAQVSAKPLRGNKPSGNASGASAARKVTET
jgi:hypothetical protein